MVKLNFNFKDLDQARLHFRQLNVNLSKNIVIRNKGMARKIRDKARSFVNAKERTGKLEQGIVVQSQKKGQKYLIISKSPAGGRKWSGMGHNFFQEYGINPNNEFGYVPGRGMQPVGKYGAKPHPGAPAKRFMFKAFKWAESEYPKSMRSTVNKTINKTFK